MSHHFAIAPRGHDALALHMMRMEAGAPNPYENWAGAKPEIVRDGIASISIGGTLTDESSGGGWWYYGETPYGLIEARLRAAMEDDDVRGVLLNVNSFGGMVSGCWALAESIHSASVRGGGRKPIWAQVKAADSAAYWLASAADRIVIEETGEAGSIGVILTHWDISAALAKYGEKVTLIFEGARKGDGSPYEPLSDEAKARFQREVTQLSNTFSTFVESYRAHAGLTLDAIKSLQADTRIGREAVAAKLADAVGHPDATWEDFKNEIKGGVAMGGPFLRRMTRLVQQRRVNMAKSAAQKKIAAKKAAKSGVKAMAGKELGSLLGELVTAAVTAEQTRDQVLAAMAEASGLSTDRVAEIVAGTGDCPDSEDLDAFAGVLDVEPSALVAAAELDGCSFDDEESGDTGAEPAGAKKPGGCDCGTDASAAVAADRKRITAIAALPQAQANPGLALAFAAEGLSVTGALRALKASGVTATRETGNRLLSALDRTPTPIVGAQRGAVAAPTVADALNPAAIYAARNKAHGAK